jgi:dynein heavy chain
LFEIEGVMIDTLKKITNQAVDDQTTRVKWVKLWPAQTVLCVNMVRWTNQAEEAIMGGTIK